MRLLLIGSEGEDTIDQVMVIVEDKYNEKEVLQDAADMIGVEDLSVMVDVDVADEGRGEFSIGRMYMG